MVVAVSGVPADLVDLDEAAEIAGRSVRTLERWIARGIIKAYGRRIGGRTEKFVSKAELEQVLRIVPLEQLDEQGRGGDQA